MLELVNIKKQYQLKDQVVDALKGINLCFRRNEFASILGPSGCGKTTLLNIIGGLDRYSEGDLIIDGVSTKQFKDKDWDNYRNHRVGFVFQSYNLIPHQTVLENVELALTLSGIKKKERRARAIAVLEKVGLGDKLKSRPNQLSGGQMQRVAIARALVNDPEIILADEPTGALDTKTSVQIMELLKEVSKDRLVIMVTHNPELAEKYSTRIVRFLDGELVEDSNPYTHTQAEKEIKKHKEKLAKQTENKGFVKTEKKKSMSFFTALGLSFKNMLTKKGRTLMVSFAGSIGIIGIALILAASAGMMGYINNMQSDSLASYPISVTSVAVDLNSLQNGVNARGDRGEPVADDELSIYDMKEMLTSYGSYNYISSEFVEYVNNHYAEKSKKDMINELQISYAGSMHLVTDYKSGENTIMYPINNVPTTSVLNGTTSSTFFEALSNEDYVRGLYEVIGNYPTESNELALVLNSRSVANYQLQELGIELPTEGNKVKLDTIINQKTYKLLLNDAYYNLDGEPVLNFNGLTDVSTIVANQSTLASLYSNENTKELKITGVLILKDDASGSIFSNGVMYSRALAEEYRQNCKASQVVANLKANVLTDKNATLKVPYKVNISELSYFTESAIYEFNTLQEMVNMLTSDSLKINLTDEQLVDLYLQMYGASYVPTGIYFYCKSFDAKDDLTTLISNWNNSNTIKIVFNDSSQMLTNMLGSIVNIISYVLVAFAAISLVVSSIMISIITYTSVIERTKEIGVLRSVGASKRDVSRVFNAETTIIGLFAGVIGIVVSFLLSLILEAVLKSLTGVAGLVSLQPLASLILIAVSVLLTFLAGLIPAKIASKKDPVLALRSE
mgnify:FL=1